MTARDLIRGSLRLIGVIASGETPAASESLDALESLNSMIKSWSGQRLTLFRIQREVFELVPQKASYTMGPLGDFNTAKSAEILGAAYGNLIKTPIFEQPEPPEDDPLTIEDESLVIPDPIIVGYTLSSNFEIPMEVINYQKFQGIQLKDTPSTIPTQIYREDLGALDRLTVWPVPSESCAVVLYGKKDLSTFEDLDAEIDLPSTYEEALKYNLAIRLAPEYGKEPSGAVVTIARESLATLRKNNSPVVMMKSDAFGLADNAKRFNILSGDFR